MKGAACVVSEWLEGEPAKQRAPLGPFSRSSFLSWSCSDLLCPHRSPRPQIEMPFVSVVARMEGHGMHVSLPIFNSERVPIIRCLEQLEKKAVVLAREEFNINSPKEVRGGWGDNGREGEVP